MAGGPRIEGRKAAAVEVIVNLDGDGAQRGGGGRRPVAKSQDRGPRVRIPLGAPVGEGGEVGEEAVHQSLIDTGQAGAVGLGPLGGNDVGDHLFHRGAAGGFGGHNTIAVEESPGEDPGGVGRVFDRDFIGVGFAQRDENLAGRGKNRAALRCGIVDGGEGK